MTSTGGVRTAEIAMRDSPSLVDRLGCVTQIWPTEEGDEKKEQSRCHYPTCDTYPLREWLVNGISQMRCASFDIIVRIILHDDSARPSWRKNVVAIEAMDRVIGAGVRRGKPHEIVTIARSVSHQRSTPGAFACIVRSFNKTATIDSVQG